MRLVMSRDGLNNKGRPRPVWSSEINIHSRYLLLLPPPNIHVPALSVTKEYLAESEELINRLSLSTQVCVPGWNTFFKKRRPDDKTSYPCYPFLIARCYLILTSFSLSYSCIINSISTGTSLSCDCG